MLGRLAAVLALAALVVTACGGGNDTEEIKGTVRDFINATNERDADKLCGKLVTTEYVEQATGATGDRARDVCREQLKLLKRPRLKLVTLGKPRIKGDKATVRAILEAQGQAQPQPFFLRKQDGDWRLTSASGG